MWDVIDRWIDELYIPGDVKKMIDRINDRRRVYNALRSVWPGVYSRPPLEITDEDLKERIRGCS